MARITDYDLYVERGAWKCENSPKGAHHWIETDRHGWFLCVHCLEQKYYPRNFVLNKTANRAVHRTEWKDGSLGCVVHPSKEDIWLQ